MKEIFAMGKPILLLAHVPFDSKLDSSLQAASKEVWQDRALIWGRGAAIIIRMKQHRNSWI